MVAAARAGATTIGIPASLRSPGLDRLIARTRGLADRVRWLEAVAGADVARDLVRRGCLLVPATTLLDARTLAPLLVDPPEAAGEAVTESVEAGAPVLVLPAEAARRFARALAAGEPLAADLTRHVEETRPKPVSAAGLYLAVRDPGHLAEAERLLYAGLGTDNDTGVDQYSPPPLLALDHARPRADAGHAEPGERPEPRHRARRGVELLARHRAVAPWSGVLLLRPGLHRGPLRWRARPPDLPGVALRRAPGLDHRHHHPLGARPRHGRLRGAGRSGHRHRRGGCLRRRAERALRPLSPPRDRGGRDGGRGPQEHGQPRPLLRAPPRLRAPARGSARRAAAARPRGRAGLADLLDRLRGRRDPRGPGPVSRAKPRRRRPISFVSSWPARSCSRRASASSATCPLRRSRHHPRCGVHAVVAARHRALPPVRADRHPR